MVICANHSVSASGAIWWVNMKMEKTASPTPTSGECVHLVMHVHFRSCDKDGGYTIRSAIPENSMLHINSMAACLMERELLPIKVAHCGNKNFWHFWLLWPWPWSDDPHIRTWPVVGGDMPHVQICTSYVKAFESYRLTDIHTDRHDQNFTPCCFTGGQKYSEMWSKLTGNWTDVERRLHQSFMHGMLLPFTCDQTFAQQCSDNSDKHIKHAPATTAVTSSLADNTWTSSEALYFHSFLSM